MKRGLEERSAKGTKGILLASHGPNGDPTFVFRVYHHGGSFTDYDILHHDMFITIEEDDAVFRNEDGENPYIDYSNQTLGYEDDKE